MIRFMMRLNAIVAVLNATLLGFNISHGNTALIVMNIACIVITLGGAEAMFRLSHR